MIHGIGVDICRISRMQKILDREGLDGPFLRKTFTEQERMESEAQQDKASFFAGRFAVKEAVFKALHEIRVDLRSIESLHHQDGSPYVNMTEELSLKMKDAGVQALHLSVSNEADYVIAFVVAE